MEELTCIVVTPERTVRETPAEFVTVTLFDGELGIAPGRAPLIGRLGCGELRITRDGKVERFYVEGGFVEVVGNAVSLLTNRAIPAEKVNATAAQSQMDAARNQPLTREHGTAREQAIAQARGQLLVARRAGSA